MKYSIGFIYLPGGFGLLDEAPLRLGIGIPFGRQGLDCYAAVKVRVSRFIDRAHPAFARLFCYPIMTQRRADHGEEHPGLVSVPLIELHFANCGHYIPVGFWQTAECTSGDSAQSWLQLVTLGLPRAQPGTHLGYFEGI